jgi:hypothetical protein
MEPSSLIMEFLCSGKFESAWKLIKENSISRDELDYHQAFKALEKDLQSQTASGDIRAANRLKRRFQALEVFQTHGLVPEKLIASVDLPHGYGGKFLLVQISGGTAHGIVCLRAGDDWHREILQNTKEEIQDLGFENADVVPLGGAWIQFDPEAMITIYGSSDEFGTCDKKVAADLISSQFPGKKILILNS